MPYLLWDKTLFERGAYRGCTRRGLVQVPHFSWLFIVYYRETSGKELERCMAISPATLLLPS